MSTVQDSTLASFVDQVYRPGATVGDSGTADKLIFESYENNSRHLPKAKERLIGINRIINSRKLGLNDCFFRRYKLRFWNMSMPLVKGWIPMLLKIL